MADWYESVEGPQLAQGDILLQCEVPSVHQIELPLPATFDVAVDRLDLVVLTQSCDLEHAKVREVLLGAVRNYRTFVTDAGPDDTLAKSSGFRQSLIRGDQPAFFLLPPSPDEAIGWSLVDFHQLFTLPKNYVAAVAGASENRWRLVPPYREHLAQGFARYFMRVGLPTTLHDFQQVKP